MAQIFHRSMNVVAKASVVFALLLVAALLAGLGGLQSSDYVTTAHTPRAQPVQFSHRHHVGGLGIDCRYCHSSVEVSSSAGIPPTETCMSCHSQVWTEAPILEPVRQSWREDRSVVWTRVHDLPDFVYFNHSIHVNKGVGCSTCHGRVDQMPLMWQVASLQMEWCLDCHNGPERYLRPRDQVFSMNYEAPADQLALGRRLAAEYRVQKLTDCYTCHR